MANYTEQIIMQTFHQMLETTPFDKITVSSLTRAAGISHNTFYYHYEDIYALLNAWLESTLRVYTQEEIDGDWKNNILEILRICREDSRVVYHIFHSLSHERLERYVFSMTDDMFWRYVRRQAEKKDLPEDYLRDVAKVCRYAIFGFFLEFLWNNMEGDVEKSVEKLAGLFTGFVANALADAPGNK